MLGLRFTQPEMSSGCPLRNTAVVRYAAPCALGLRPSPVPGSDHRLFLFQSASFIASCPIRRAVTEQRKRPQTVNRPEGKNTPLRRLNCVKGNSGLRLICDRKLSRHI